MCETITLCAKLAAGAGLGRSIRTSDISELNSAHLISDVRS
jgi:hypothetical protein